MILYCLIRLKFITASAYFFPPYYAEHREAWTEFSEPILQEQSVVFSKTVKLKGKTKWPEDFYNYIIGLNAGFNPESMAGKEFATAIKMGLIKLAMQKTKHQI